MKSCQVNVDSELPVLIVAVKGMKFELWVNKKIETKKNLYQLF